MEMSKKRIVAVIAICVTIFVTGFCTAIACINAGMRVSIPKIQWSETTYDLRLETTVSDSTTP